MYPEVRIIALTLNNASLEQHAESLYVDALYTSFAQTVSNVTIDLDGGEASADDERPNPLSGSGRGDGELGQELDRIAARLSMPVASIYLLDDERHMADEDAARLTRHIVDTKAPLIMRLDEPHQILGESAYIQTNSIGLYVGVPLLQQDGRAIGALVVMDYEARPFTNEQVVALLSSTAEIMQRFDKEEPVGTRLGQSEIWATAKAGDIHEAPKL